MTGPSTPAPLVAVDQHRAYEEVNALLARLPEQEATVLQLVYFQSQTLATAAAHLRMDIPAATALTARALRHLAEHLLDRSDIDGA